MMATMLVLVTVLAGTVEAATLQKRTVHAFDHYVALTEHRIEREREVDGSFLVTDALSEAEAVGVHRQLLAGEVVTRRLETFEKDGGAIEVPKGMIHHWVGAVFVPGARLDALVPWITNYDAHHRYFDEVQASRLISRHGDEYRVHLRLRRKKVVTVHYDTEHHVTYRRHGPGRLSSRSYATRIAELADAGTSKEMEKPIGDDSGFLWRLNSYWRFKEVEGGVVVECESVSLSRSVPFAVRWIVGRYIDSVPRESLDATLRPIREAHGTRSTLVQASSLRSNIR